MFIKEGGSELNVSVTSKEEIIRQCQLMVQTEGLGSISIRSVAKKCKISVGAVYNYFPSKSALLSAVIGSIWLDIFHMQEDSFSFSDFIACLSWLFESIQEGGKKYPDFFSSHISVLASDEKEIGKKMMEEYFSHIKESLLNVILADKKIKESAFNKVLTPELFVEYIFQLFMYATMNDAKNSQGILELARKYLY
jgi:AcrR family transcriptional regulator